MERGRSKKYCANGADQCNRPTALWLAHEIAAAFANQAIPDLLVRDNDGAYGVTFRRQLRAMGVRDSPTEPHSPWQNGHVERLIGSIRRECLDHHIIFLARHLRRVLWRYADYYNADPTHRALGKDPPDSRSIEPRGRVSAESATAPQENFSWMPVATPTPWLTTLAVAAAVAASANDPWRKCRR